MLSITCNVGEIIESQRVRDLSAQFCSLLQSCSVLFGHPLWQLMRNRSMCTVPHAYTQFFHMCSLLNTAAATVCFTFKRRYAHALFVQPALQLSPPTRWQSSLEVMRRSWRRCDHFQRLRLMCCSGLPFLVSFRLATAEVRRACDRRFENRVAAHIVRRCVSVVAVRLLAACKVDFCLNASKSVGLERHRP